MQLFIGVNEVYLRLFPYWLATVDTFMYISSREMKNRLLKTMIRGNIKVPTSVRFRNNVLFGLYWLI